MAPQVTILIPNYKTPEITKLCLRLIKKHTDLDRVRIVVVDNDSRDASLDYLRSLAWIDLIERKAVVDETPSLSHSRALDLALATVTTPYVLSFHTDTFVRQPKWLDFLLAQIESNENIGGVGSWKLELKPLHKRILKRLETLWESAWYSAIGKDKSSLEGTSHHQKYLRSHCALYRTELLQRYNLSFAADRVTAGKILHQQLVAHGHQMVFLEAEIVSRYLVHLNHATMVLNPELGIKLSSMKKEKRRIVRILKELQSDAVLADDSLDQVFKGKTH